MVRIIEINNKHIINTYIKQSTAEIIFKVLEIRWFFLH